MDKIAIVTISIGDFYSKMAEITHPNIKSYADKIGADFITLTDIGSHSLPHYRKLDIAALLDKYDRILYIDTDILVRDDTPNLFDIVPNDSLGIFEEGKYHKDRIAQFKNFCLETGYDFSRWKGKYYNTGVMLLSKQHKNILDAPENEVEHFFEQSYLNAMIDYRDVKVFELDYKFNRMPWFDQIIPDERYDSYFIHYAGMSLHMPEQELLELIAKDKKDWQENSPKHHYWDKVDKMLGLHNHAIPSYRMHKAIKNKIENNWLFMVSGGIGDEICAEPTLRFINERWPHIKLTVCSFHPELFSHLKLEANLNHDKMVRVDWNKYVRFDTLPKIDALAWDFVNHFLVNPVDYVSIITIRRQLPLKNRQPFVPTKRPSDDIAQQILTGKRKVLIHAGSHWQTKTYPAHFWNNVMLEVKQAGFDVVLVGASAVEEGPGTVDVDASLADIDLRNRVDLLELSWLTKNSHALVSNDSMPIHVAASHCNKIAVITTCKHPDNLGHWRADKNGQYVYSMNMKFFQKGGMWDIQNDCLNQNETVLSDKTDPQNILSWLPDPKDISRWLAQD